MIHIPQARTTTGGANEGVHDRIETLSPHLQLWRLFEEALRDRLVCGMTSSSTQKKLLAEKNLTLQRAIDIAIAAEMATLDHQQETTLSVQSEVHNVSYTKVCNACGKRGHTANRCRFRTVTCYKCGKQGHLQVVCKEPVKVPDKHYS